MIGGMDIGCLLKIELDRKNKVAIMMQF